MQYSIAKEIFGTPWQISAIGIQQYKPIMAGMLNGAVIVAEDEPKENIPFNISAKTLMPLALSDNEDIEENDPEKEKVIHVLPVRGVMIKHDMVCGPRGTRTLANRLRSADVDESVIGHIMIIEGPGGSADAIAELTDAMQECKKPIVVWVDGMMCSAHMYAGSYAKEIIASRKTDWIGCIGTLIMFQGRKAKSDEDLFNVREVTIYADQAFEKNEEYEKAINEFDFKLTKELILNPYNEQFIKDIKSNRPGVEDKHLHGRTFPAGEVVGSLVDSIGSFDDAVKRIIALSDFKSPSASDSTKAAGKIQNKIIMKLKNIQSVLGLSDEEFVAEADGRRTFTQEEMDAVENALGQTDLSKLQSQLDSASEVAGQRDATITDLKNQLEKTNNTIAERDQTIEALNEEIAELKNDAADSGAQVHKKTDGDGKTEGKAIAEKYENPFDALEDVSQEYLGKTIKN
jgi:ClpP class serine protease